MNNIVSMIRSSDQLNEKLSWRWDGDQKAFLKALAHGTLTAKAFYKIIANEYGYLTAALTTKTGPCLIGCSITAGTSATYCELQVVGFVDDAGVGSSLSVSTGHALELTDGVISDGGEDYAARKGEFAIACETTTSSTTCDVLLLGWEVDDSYEVFMDDEKLSFGDADDVTIEWDTALTPDQLLIETAADDTIISIGASAATQLSFDVKWYANEASGASYLYMDASANLIYTVGIDHLIGDDDYIKFGNGTSNAGDITLEWDTAAATDHLIMAAVGAAEAFDIGVTSHVINTTFTGTVTVGVDDQGYDVKLFGDTASAYVQWDSSDNALEFGGVGRIDFTGATPTTAAGAIFKAGSSANEFAVDGNEVICDTADTKFVSMYFDCGATGGTARGMYLKLFLTGTTGGEALRAYTVCISNTPADTVNGAHISIGYGTTVGNCTGLATAARMTVMVPARTLTGTVAAVQAELYATDTTSTSSGLMSCIRFSVAGNATGLTLITRAAYAMHFDSGCVDSSDGIVDTNLTGTTVGGAIKIYIDGVGKRWLKYYTD